MQCSCQSSKSGYVYLIVGKSPGVGAALKDVSVKAGWVAGGTFLPPASAVVKIKNNVADDGIELIDSAVQLIGGLDSDGGAVYPFKRDG